MGLIVLFMNLGVLMSPAVFFLVDKQLYILGIIPLKLIADVTLIGVTINDYSRKKYGSYFFYLLACGTLFLVFTLFSGHCSTAIHGKKGSLEHNHKKRSIKDSAFNQMTSTTMSNKTKKIPFLGLDCFLCPYILLNFICLSSWLLFNME